MKSKKESIAGSSPNELEKELAKITLELERKNRDLEIEAALERVRAVAMGMSNPDDLLSICETMFRELKKLGFSDLRNAMIDIHYEAKEYLLNYDYSENTGKTITTFKYNSHPIVDHLIYHAKQSNDVFTEMVYSGKALDELRVFRKENGEADDVRLDNVEALYYYFYVIGTGAIGISTFSAANLEQLDVLKRFRNVFDLAYKRYIDITNAEAQAREAQIEMTLERVRARTMAMHHSDELAETAYILFQQFKELGENPDQATIGIINEAEGVIEYWVTLYGSRANRVFKFPVDEPNVTRKIYRAWKKHEKSLVIDLSGKALHNFSKFRETMGGAGYNADEKRRIINVAFFSKGLINVQSTVERSVESLRLLERFANVFEGTYTRFLDLKKAEAQAREAQIELALERVRAKTTAMQHSDELLETSQVVFQQLRDLGETADQISIGIVKEEEGIFDLFATIYGTQMVRVVHPKIDDHFIMGRVYKNWKAHKKSFVVELGGEELRRYNVLRNQLGGQNYYNEDIGPDDSWIVSCASFSKGVLSFSSSIEPTKEAAQLLERFTKVFEQTYTRFVDLQKAEAQAKEAQIEAALEKVRSRSLAMHQTDELREVVTVVFDKLHDLGIVMEEEAASIVIFTEGTKDLILWNAIPDQLYSKSFHIPYYDTAVIKSLVDAKSEGADFFKRNYTAEEKDHFWKWAVEYSDYKNIPDDRKKHILERKYFACSVAYAKNSAILVSSYDGKLLSEKESEILKRFARVFEQAYVRFLDLHKAEAQAREAQIELALERVRASAMAMRDSKELSGMVSTVFGELTKLDFALTRCAIVIADADSSGKMVWMANSEAGQPPISFYRKSLDHPYPKAVNEQLKKGTPKWVYHLKGAEKKAMDNYYANSGEVAHIPDAIKQAMDMPESIILSHSFNNFGYLRADSMEFLSEDNLDILYRFAKVFDMCYTRFTDIRQAEAQAREAEIELGLERVRARSMAMQKSDELQEIIKVVYEQLVHLNILVEHAGFIMDYNTRDDMHIWLADKHYAPSEITVPYFDSPHWNGFNEAKQKGSNFFAIYSGFEEKNKFYQDLFKLTPEVTDETKEYYFSCPGLAISTVLLENVGLYIENFSGTPFTDDENSTLMRFGKVFQQTYTRFLDLKHAEGQAREAQIQLALERVRARTMAMQKSDELAETVSLLFKQLLGLGIRTEQIRTCGIVTFDDNNPVGEQWITETNGEIIPKSFMVPYDEAPAYKTIYKAWKDGEEFMVIHLEGEKLKEHLGYLSKAANVPTRDVVLPQQAKEIFNHVMFFSQGCLFIITKEGLPEYHEVFKRFGTVFQQSYTRFLDLQKAEEHSKEAQIELAMERIRARAMAMHSSSELTEVANVLREQMGLLNQPELEVSAVHLYNDDSETFDSWYTVPSANDPDRKIRNGIFTVPKDCCALIREMITMYRSPVSDYTIEASGEKMQEWFEVLLKAAPELGENARLRNPGGPKTNYFHFSDFGGGSLVMASLKEPSEEVITLQRRAASVLDLAYRRFLDLKKVEAQTREAQIELGLERVRARAMAMQKSDELKEAIQLIYEQLKQLNFNIDSANFALDYKESDDFNLWLSSAGQLYPTKVHIPYIDIPIYNRFIEAKKNEVDFLTENYSFEEKNAFFDHFFKNVQGVTDERKEFVMGTAGYARSTVLMKDVTLSIQNYAAIPYSDEENAALRRFGKVFEQTYTRFLDLQQAEAQAREAKIEAGLERVRAKAMSMQTSEELNALLGTVFDELTKLNLVLTRCVIVIYEPGTNSCRWWMANSEAPAAPMNFFVKYHKLRPYMAYLKGWQDRVLKWQYVLKGKVKRDWDDFLFTETELSLLPGFVIDGMKAPGEVLLSSSFYNFGCLTLASLEPLSDEGFDIMRRFGKVFDMSYTRFNDLKQAEAQAREAQIEAALEKVRGKAMAMHDSNDLSSAVSLVFTELKKLGIKPIRCGIGLFAKDKPQSLLYTATISNDSDALDLVGWVDMVGHPVLEKIYDSWLHQEDYFPVLNGKELKTYYKKLSHGLHIPSIPDGKNDEKQYGNFLAFPEGMLNAWAERPYAEPELKILDRFKKIISLTFRRYLDLQKAEAQARESQIQLALERVRARTMAMQKSEELAEVIQVVHDQLYQLDFNIDVANFVLNYNERDDFDLWLAVHGQRYATKIHVPYFDHPIFNRFNEAKEKGLDFFADSFTFKEKNIFFKHFFENTPGIPEERKAAVFGATGYARYTVFMKNIALAIANYAAIPYSEAENAVFRRFANVFEQTYTRFLDLQKAEAQARESQIQLGLERVRAAAMAMHNSKDVGNATALVFSEFYKLGITTIRCGVCIIDGPAQQMEVWSASSLPDGMMNMGAGKLDMKAHPLWLHLLDAWQQKKASFSYELAGKELTDYYNAIKNAASYQISESDKPGEFFEINQFCNCYLFNEGCLFAFTQAPFSPEANQVLEKFASVFGLTYRRYLDLTKAEAQAREAQIEAALERVRSRTMAMHDSRGVADTSATMFQELVKLGVEPTVRCGVSIINSVNDLEVWTASLKNDGSITLNYGHLDMTAHPLFMNVFTEWQRKESSTTYELTGDAVRSYFQALNDAPGYPFQYPMDALPEKWGINAFFFREGCLFAFTSEPLSPEMSQVFKRFAGVYGQTYRRYLDLQKAEAQAREARIETSLERVRSKAMAMRSSEDLADAIGVFYHELGLLSVTPRRCGLGLIDKETRLVELSTMNTIDQGNSMEIVGELKLAGHPVLEGIYDNWLRQQEYHPVLRGNDIKAYYQVIQSQISYPDYPDDAVQYGYYFFFRDGGIFAWTETELPEAEVQIYRRFNSVISLTYRRYKDIREAEAQAREAQIETSLERVRARALAMHQSQDINTAVLAVFEELEKLNLNILRCGIGIIDKENQVGDVWTTVKLDGKSSIQVSGKEPMNIHPLFQGTFDAWLNQTDFLYELTGDDLVAYYRAVAGTNFTLPESHSLTDENQGAHQYYYTPTFKTGNLYAFRESPFPEDAKAIMRRFASVLNLTFSRFLDLQKAEAQAREAQIEAALERVRSKAMAMRNSNDLLTAASTVFTELQNLGIKQIRSGVGLIAKDFHKARVYTATSSQSAIDLSLMGEVTLYGHPVFEQQYQSWLNGENYFVALEGAALASYYKILSAGLNANLGATVKKNKKEYGHWFMFSEGFLYAWSDMEYTDAEIKILERFKNVMELTIRRYIELQKSETQAREAVRQASLDRVRAEIASMRTTKDLERITPLIWNELTILGVPFIRCGVFIMDEQLQEIHTYLSTPDGKAIAAFQLPFNDNSGNGVSNAALRGWRQKQGVTLHWTEEEFKNFSHTLVARGEITSEESYLTQRTVTGLDLHFFPFLQGMLYAGNTEPLSDDDKDLVQSLADAFSTAYARYEDFNSLELAKQEVELTLTDLKATQTKLIQSEKMASLGELTAGIAHEIQNPLNFVNNFSEVNQEMIDELEEELNAGNIEEALAIAADIKQNEQKINHHGKRADGIVKGMLQHSRTGGGEKQPTNINSVAEEYMRLSYHGLRAKDKAFNAEMIMDFDPELPRVEAVGQDIGRVFLNLFNNAFYAVNQKKKTDGDGYNPEVSVSTAVENGQVIIKVKDNGVGMTDYVKEKIMQPFFTTKPTGEGTGLGLSLTYDMVVKGHGGSIQVNSVEGEGSEFIIQLPIS